MYGTQADDHTGGNIWRIDRYVSEKYLQNIVVYQIIDHDHSLSSDEIRNVIMADILQSVKSPC